MYVDNRLFPAFVVSSLNGFAMFIYFLQEIAVHTHRTLSVTIRGFYWKSEFEYNARIERRGGSCSVR